MSCCFAIWLYVCVICTHNLYTLISTYTCRISRLPEHHYPYLQDNIDEGRTYFVRDLPYSLDFLLENFMDPAHIPYAHHSLQGTRDDGSPLEIGVLESNFTHVEASFKDISGGKKRDGVLSFQRPALYHFRTRANATADYTPNLLIFTAPIEEGKCRAILPDFKIGPFPSWLGHLGSNRFLNTDTWLHDAERNARIHMNTLNKQKGSVSVGAAKEGRRSTDGLNYIFATKSDLGPSLFRKWWTKHGLANSPPNTYGASSVSLRPYLCWWSSAETQRKNQKLKVKPSGSLLFRAL